MLPGINLETCSSSIWYYGLSRSCALTSTRINKWFGHHGEMYQDKFCDWIHATNMRQVIWSKCYPLPYTDTYMHAPNIRTLIGFLDACLLSKESDRIGMKHETCLLEHGCRRLNLHLWISKATRRSHRSKRTNSA